MRVPPDHTFTKEGPQPAGLRIPQARVLRALMPKSGSKTRPVLTPVELAENAGFSPTSGTINRVLHGIPKGSSSGNPHKGLLDLGLLSAIDQDGSTAYRITTAGIKAVERHPKLPKMRDKEICINNRYLQDLPEDLREIEQQNIDLTTKEALIDARLGEGKFRTRVLEAWENCCAVTGSGVEAAIRASHIKSWRDSTNNERVDPNNGLPLTASLDALFDAGLISFGSSGKLLASANLNTAERKIYGIINKSLRRKPTDKMAEYLAYHRAKYGFGS